MAKKIPKCLVCDLDAILKHHNLLSSEILKKISTDFREIGTNPRKNAWQENQFSGEVNLYAWSIDSNLRAATPKAGGSLPVFAITDLENKNKSELLYVSLNECWKKEKIHTRKYELLSINMAFYSGLKDRPGQVSDRLFRAEWVQERQGDEVVAAHPHWHVDWPLGLAFDKEINGIHLGMAGWEHESSGGFHEHWKRYVATLAEARLWIKRVMKYGIDQFDQYYWP